MNCPECHKEILELPKKPSNTVTGTTTFTMINDTQLNYAVPEYETTEVFKCCNPKCWVTRVEVDWGQS